jgi:prolyl-tRNA synthetase
MRMSTLLLRTLRDAPADAEAASHRLLVRGGYIRRVAAGVYTFLPLGWAVLRNIERIVRDEMDGAGAQELLMPALQPVELWEQSGRAALLDDAYSAFRVEGRGGRFVLGPTHEELVTATVAADLESYRDLPVIVYQIQVKFRDEARPRFGVLRGREFLMGDAYSFDADAAGMHASYARMYDAYRRVFDRCQLEYRPVEAVSGAIGGDVSHEFMVLSAIGEDHFAVCDACGYAANTEAAEVGPPAVGKSLPPEEPLTEHHTPDRPGIDLVVEFFSDRSLTAGAMLKCIAAVTDGGAPAVILVPGDREARLPAGWRPFDDADFGSHPGLVKGYIGPMALGAQGVRVVADHSVRRPGRWVTGANRGDHHVTGCTLGRDFTVDEWGSYVVAAAGDACPRCGAVLALQRAVECGHTFQFATRYSECMAGATFLGDDGVARPFWMGSYGIGVSRLLAVVAEQHHDAAGLIWPADLAPYELHLLALGVDRKPEVAAAADELYARLTAAGHRVLYDDREASAGVKFADADLIGCPTQLILGARALAEGMVERKDRRSGGRDHVPLANLRQ